MSSEEKTTNAPATCCCRVEFRDGWIVANRGFESRLQETDKNILVFISISYRFPLPLELWRQITWEVLPLFRYTSWLKLSRPLKIANDICIFWGDQCITLIFPTQRTQWSWHVLARRGSWSWSHLGAILILLPSKWNGEMKTSFEKMPHDIKLTMLVHLHVRVLLFAPVPILHRNLNNLQNFHGVIPGSVFSGN